MEPGRQTPADDASCRKHKIDKTDKGDRSSASFARGCQSQPSLYVSRTPPSRGAAASSKRQDFSHRVADEKSLLDEALRRGRESVAGGSGGLVAERSVAGILWLSGLRVFSRSAQHSRVRVLVGLKTRLQEDWDVCVSSPGSDRYGTLNRGHSASSLVRALPQWGQHGVSS